jgi:hypothetical protein
MGDRLLLDNANNDSVTVAVTSTEVIAANRIRAYAAITNDSDEIVYLSFGSAAVLNSGVRLNPRGGSFEIGGSGDSYFGSVYAICASGGKNVTVVEFSHIH